MMNLRWLLLALLLGAARERIDISWQRADESGRSRTPSLALREVARNGAFFSEDISSRIVIGEAN